MKFAWLTDLHLEFLSTKRCRDFTAALAAKRFDGLLLGGDIGTAPTVGAFLSELYKDLGIPIYFVLGNHDFYHGSIHEVRREISTLCAACSGLVYLTEQRFIELSNSTALLGHDGWYDFGFGDVSLAPFRLNDFELIDELTGLSPHEERAAVEILATEAKEHIETNLAQAMRRFERVILLTHVPPFKDACLYRGEPTLEGAIPFFCSRMIGDAIMRVAPQYPAAKLLVLCGHTHHAAHLQVATNVAVMTGAAEYERPAVADVIVI